MIADVFRRPVVTASGDRVLDMGLDAGRDSATGRRSKLLFVSYTSKTSGPTHSLIHLLRELAGRYEVGVLAPSELGPSDLASGDGELVQKAAALGVEVAVLPRLGFRTVPAIARHIRAGKYDLVYGNDPNSACQAAAVAAKLMGRPFIWHIRGMKHDWGWSQGVFVRYADRVVAVSDSCAAPLRRFRRRGDIDVVYNGIAPQDFEQDRADCRRSLIRELDLPVDATLLISASHISRRKGMDLGLEAFAKVAAGRNVHWLVAGSLEREPEYAQEFREQIRRLGLGDQVHLLGLRREMPKLLAGSDVFVHTALADPHPRAVLEAMAAGLPVVAFGVDGVAETVVDGETGVLASRGDTRGLRDGLRRLLDDVALRERMGQLSRKRIFEHFTATNTASRVSALLDETLGRNGTHKNALR